MQGLAEPPLAPAAVSAAAVDSQTAPPPPKDKAEAASEAAPPSTQPPQLFAGLKVKDVDRQFREYVYMTVTAVKYVPFSLIFSVCDADWTLL